MSNLHLEGKDLLPAYLVVRHGNQRKEITLKFLLKNLDQNVARDLFLLFE